MCNTFEWGSHFGFVVSLLNHALPVQLIGNEVEHVGIVVALIFLTSWCKIHTDRLASERSTFQKI